MRLSIYLVLFAFLGMVVFVSCEKAENLVPQESVQVEQQLNYVPNQVLIKFKDGSSSLKASQNILGLIDGKIVESISTEAMKIERTTKGLQTNEILLVNSKFSTMETIEILKDRAEIELVEPNWVYNHFATSNDLYYANGTLWGMYGDGTSPANQYGSQAGEAWAAGKTGSSTVYIGIIDEGYMYTHEDLAANAGTNPGEIAANGVDDDGNGYVDDVYGWDFAGGDNTVFDGTGDDHGTHVAGTIGGVGGNGIGVAGVVWNVKLLSGKFLGSRGGTTANAIKAVDYFTDLKTRHGINLVATNNSWGGGGFSQLLQDAIERANNAGILFIAAAGNESYNIEVTASYPAGYPNANIISVASITNTGALSSFSNYGSTKVDLGAPGSSIMSCVPKSSKGKLISGYASYSGTSMATPHVTGGVALYASTHPGASAATIKSAVLGSVVPTASLSGKTLTGGRLNVSGF